MNQGQLKIYDWGQYKTKFKNKKALETVKPSSLKVENKGVIITIKACIGLTKWKLSDTFIHILEEAGYKIIRDGDLFIIENADLIGYRRKDLESSLASFDKYGFPTRQKDIKGYYDLNSLEYMSIDNNIYNYGWLDGKAIVGNNKYGHFSHSYKGYMFALSLPDIFKLNSALEKESDSIDFIIITEDKRSTKDQI